MAAAPEEELTAEDWARIDACRRRYILVCRGLPAWIAANGAVEAIHCIAGTCGPDFRKDVARALRGMADHLEVCEGPGEADERVVHPSLTPDGPPPGTKLC